MRRETFQNGSSSQRERMNKAKASKTNFFSGHSSIEEAKEKTKFSSELNRYWRSNTNGFVTEWQLSQ